MRVPTRETTATRLLQSADRLTLDPDVEVPWDDGLVDGLWFTPPERSSLYGTDLWEQMGHDQRVELTRHEVASIASTGIWFENILTRMLNRQLYHLPPTDPHVQFALIEIADECRHSRMFARMVDTLEVDAYQPPGWLRWAGSAFASLADELTAHAGALYVEQLLDTLQREAADDGRVQPLVRAVSRVHVTEESRHMRFAGDELRRAAAGPRRKRLAAQVLLPAVCHLSSVALIDPRVYADVGLDVDEAARQAAANPHWRKTRKDAAARAFATFDACGLSPLPARVAQRLLRLR